MAVATTGGRLMVLHGLLVQVGPWTRMKRKTVGGVIPDDIPAAQRARTEAALKVWAISTGMVVCLRRQSRLGLVMHWLHSQHSSCCISSS